MSVSLSSSALIGNTPLLRLCRIERALGLRAKLIAKLEFLNPAGSVKDRVALAMIEDAEGSGDLRPGATVIEPTSGNTGIGLCAICAARGYRAVIVMPDSMSPERIKLMRAYGADVVLTDGKLGMAGAIDRAQALHRQIEGSLIAGQFDNPANPRAHFETTGPELYADAEGEIDAFVAGVGTGGTITGVGRYLKSKRPEILVVGVEPAESPLLSEGRSGSHGIMGIGANFLPKVLDREILDEVLPITTEQAYEAARMLATKEGVLCGISSGAALSAAIEIAMRREMEGKTVSVLLPDGGERYLSTALFGDQA